MQKHRLRLKAAKLKTGDDITDLAIQVYAWPERWLQDKVATVALEQYYNAIPREMVTGIGRLSGDGGFGAVL